MGSSYIKTAAASAKLIPILRPSAATNQNSSFCKAIWRPPPETHINIHTFTTELKCLQLFYNCAAHGSVKLPSSDSTGTKEYE